MENKWYFGYVSIKTSLTQPVFPLLPTFKTYKAESYPKKKKEHTILSMLKIIMKPISQISQSRYG